MGHYQSKKKKREMQLHKFYKCDLCQEFHPVELDLYLKVAIEMLVREFAYMEGERATSIQNLRFSLLRLLLETSTPREARGSIHYIEKISAHDALRNLNPRREGNRRQVEISFYVVKCIKLNQRLCTHKARWLFDWPDESHYNKRAVELITSEANEQWMEIIGFKMHVKPLWFTGNAVYQFRTQIVDPSATSDFGDLRHYECNIMLDGEMKKILTFDLMFNSKESFGSFGPEKTLDDVKPYLLVLAATRLKQLKNKNHLVIHHETLTGTRHSTLVAKLSHITPFRVAPLLLCCL